MRHHPSRIATLMPAAMAALLALLTAAARGAAGPAAEAPAFITRGQLEQLPIESIADPKTLENALIFPDAKTGIFFPSTEILAGDPIPAWLIIKSLAKEPTRGLMADVDLGVIGEKPRVDGTARLQLLRENAGKLDSIAEFKGKTGRSAPRIFLPPEGFFVNSGDVNNLAPGPLGPGEYRLRFWAEGQRAESKFRIIARPAGAPVRERRRVAFAQAHDAMVLNWMGALQGRPVQKGGIMQWTARNGYFAIRSVEDFRLGLALGVGTGNAARHYSRIADIPAQDDVVSISCKLKEGSTDHLQITLTPVWAGANQPAAASVPATAPATVPATAAATAPATAPATVAAKAPAGPAAAWVRQGRNAPAATPIPANEYQLPGYPILYFIVESLGPPVGVHLMSERQGGGNTLGTRFSVPIVIEAQLPPEWSSRLSFTGKIKLSAVFAAGQIRGGLEQEGDGYDPGAAAAYARTLRPITKRWAGIVKSAPVELTVKGNR